MKGDGIRMDKIIVPNMGDLNRRLNESMRVMHDFNALEKDEKRRYEQETLQTLRNIESNTTGLNEITTLLSSNLGKQDELLELLKESLSISASNSREEAEGKWRKLMKKTNELTDDVDTIQKVQGFANTVYHLFINSGI